MSRGVEAAWPRLPVEGVVVAAPEPRAPWGGAATVVSGALG